MLTTPVLIGIGAIWIITFILGIYLGKKGVAETFANPNNPMRMPLMLLAFIPVLIVYWLQQSHGFIATPSHIAITFGCFLGGSIIGRMFR